jgi:hypothetical protein
MDPGDEHCIALESPSVLNFILSLYDIPASH